MARRWRLRQVVNALNGSTLLGLAVASVGKASLSAGPDGLVLATGYRLRVPRAAAFTLGNVVLWRHSRAQLLARPRLLAHEARHATQWAWCFGPVFLPLYAAAALWSRVRGGTFATYNIFEQRAGLADGGYLPGAPAGNGTDQADLHAEGQNGRHA